MNLLAVRLLSDKFKIKDIYGISYTVFDEQYWEASISSPALPRVTIIVQCTLPNSSDVVDIHNIACHIYVYDWKIFSEKYSSEQRKEASKLLSIFRTHICGMSISSAFEYVCQCRIQQ